MSRPVILDLFCGAGGCAVGYHRAGFDVVGVDIKPQPRYPFDFQLCDALEYLPLLAGYANGLYDAIHASPPCQQYTVLKSVCGGKKYPDLVAKTRAALKKTRLPYVIENVPGAPLINPIMLCASMFPGHRVYRHRLFESNIPLTAPAHPKHTVRVNRRKINRREHWDAGGYVTVTGDIGAYVGPEAMGIDWMTGNELSQAIPPAYTEFVGRQLLDAHEWDGSYLVAKNQGADIGPQLPNEIALERSR